MSITDLTVADLAAFEEDIAASFNRGEFKFPIHLSSGNEQQLISIFEDIRPQDWIFGSWRLHLHALLKGVGREELRAAIMRGESMALRFDKQRVYGSAIVGGSLPIALGAAIGQGFRAGPHIWCFMGDMTALSGIARECMAYAANHRLPMTFVVEDNGVSVCTDTRAVWGLDREEYSEPDVRRYKYRSKWPHAGAGVRVQF